MNNVILIGRLARDPELSYTPQTQTAACRITLAVDRPKKDAGADFIRVTVWGNQAENCNRYLSKGRQCAVQGRIQTGSYTDRNGNKVYTTDVVAERVEFIGSSGENSRSDGRNNANGNTYQPQQNAPQNANYNDELPDNFAQAETDIPF